MTRPPCVRLCPAYPGNPRTRIEGESPPLCKGTYGLRSVRVGARVLKDGRESGPWGHPSRRIRFADAPQNEGSNFHSLAGWVEVAEPAHRAESAADTHHARLRAVMGFTSGSVSWNLPMLPVER